MAHSVTLVESNPVTQVYCPDNAGVTSAGKTGSELVLGGTSTTKGHQIQGIMIVGDNTLDASLSFYFEGKYGGTWDTANKIKEVVIPAGEDDRTAVICLHDSEIRDLGITNVGSPYEAIRYQVATTGSNRAVLGVIILAGDLRYGLSGTSAEIADQMVTAVKAHVLL